MYLNSETFIRPATAADQHAILEIIREIFESYDMINDPENDYPDLIDFEKNYPPGQQELFVMEYRKEVIGCGGVMLDGENVPFLSRIYISSSYPGQGLGQKLVEFLITEALQYSNRVYLWTDTRFTKAHKLYEKLGFVSDGRCKPLHDINDSYEWYYEFKSNRSATP